MDLLDGKVSLITGAGQGIGASAAHLFAREGAFVVLSSRNEEKMAAIVRGIHEDGGKAIAVKTDVTDAESMETLVKEIMDVHGRLDIAFNNAGTSGVFKSLPEITEGEFDNILGTNLKGTFLSMKHEIPAMLSGGGGAIVNMSSVTGLVGKANIAPYVASKHGVIGLTKTAALEFAKQNIRINAIAPGTTLTEKLKMMTEDKKVKGQLTHLIPVGRLASMTEIAKAALWLCSDAASYVTGVTLPVDGGYSVP